MQHQSHSRGDTHVLVVCTANVCRSPMGEALLRKALRRAKVDVSVSSAGVRAGALRLPVDPVAVRLMANQRLDISRHVPRQLTPRMVREADVVLTMTRHDLREVVVATPDAFHKTFTWRYAMRRTEEDGPFDDWNTWLEMLNEGRNTAELLKDSPIDDVPDAYGLEPAKYDACLEQLLDLSDHLAEVLRGMTGR